MKIMAALHAPELGSTLIGADVRGDFETLGATRLQVNLDDAEVAPAMRFGPGPSITAVLSIWVPDDDDGEHRDPAPFVDVLRGLDPSVDAWRVEERIPLPSPAVPDGQRAEALANIAFLRRPATLTPSEWRADWLDRHTQVAIDTQGTFGYVQNPVLDTLTGAAPDVAGIVEELFPVAAMTDHHAFYGSGGDEAEFQRRFATLMASCERFGASSGLDLVPTSRYVFTLR